MPIGILAGVHAEPHCTCVLDRRFVLNVSFRPGSGVLIPSNGDGSPTPAAAQVRNSPVMLARSVHASTCCRRLETLRGANSGFGCSLITSCSGYKLRTSTACLENIATMQATGAQPSGSGGNGTDAPRVSSVQAIISIEPRRCGCTLGLAATIRHSKHIWCACSCKWLRNTDDLLSVLTLVLTLVSSRSAWHTGISRS